MLSRGGMVLRIPIAQGMEAIMNNNKNAELVLRNQAVLVIRKPNDRSFLFIFQTRSSVPLYMYSVDR